MQALGIGEESSKGGLSDGREGVAEGQVEGVDLGAAASNGCSSLEVQHNGAPDRPAHQGCPSQC